jgi:para-nitrobenzyl esterase
MSEAVVVDTSAGKVRGLQRDGVAAFLGVPYGQDTVSCRFQPALPRLPWPGVKDCTAFACQAPQGRLNVNGLQIGANADPQYTRAAAAIFNSGSAERQPESEDCLVLNVYTPQVSGHRPVMVWLHGGGFSMGSAGNQQYDGSALCRRGNVVVVTLNHRLGALGYLYLGDLSDRFADSGNIGQLDIVLALQWVRENIAAFGGDPRNVTVFGASGGGAKISALLSMPATRGLIHKAIIQSGPAARMVEKADAAQITERTLQTLGIARSQLDRLLTMDREPLMAAASAAQRPSNGIVDGALAPVVDGRSLPTHPFEPAASAQMQELPLLIGTTRDEWTLMTALEADFGTMSPAQAKARFLRALGKDGEGAFDLYRSLTPDDLPTYWVTDMMTDLMMRAESIEMAERKAAQAAPVFMYRLDWQSPVLGGALRSPHCLDVPLMFENLAGAPQLVGDGMDTFCTHIGSVAA